MEDNAVHEMFDGSLDSAGPGDWKCRRELRKTEHRKLLQDS